MATMTRAEAIAQAQRKIALYDEAEEAVLSGKAWNMAGQSLTREDLDKIMQWRQYWEKRLAALMNMSQDWQALPVSIRRD